MRFEINVSTSFINLLNIFNIFQYIHHSEMNEIMKFKLVKISNSISNIKNNLKTFLKQAQGRTEIFVRKILKY